MTTTNQANLAAVNSIDAFKKLHPEGLQKVMNEVFLADLDLLEEEEGFNPRDYNSPATIAHIESLAKQWADDPSQIPSLRVIIKEGRILVRDGHCRRRGALLARSRGTEIKRIRCERVTGDELAQNMMVLTSQEGLKLDDIARAKMYQRLIGFGHTIEELAAHLNRSGQHVRDVLEVGQLPMSLQGKISQGIISSHLAVELFTLHGEKEAIARIEQAEKIQTEAWQAALEKAAKKAEKTTPAQPPLAGETEGQSEATDKAAASNEPTEQAPADAPAQPAVRVTRKHINALAETKKPAFTAKVKEDVAGLFKTISTSLRQSKASTDGVTLVLTQEQVAKLMTLNDLINGLETPAESGAAEDGKQIDLLGQTPELEQDEMGCDLSGLTTH